jgi:hypothetical protein
MNKEETKKILRQLWSIYPLLDELELKARNYKNRGIKHNLDGNILYRLEDMHEKITTILYLFYLGDAERDFREGKISFEEMEKLMDSKSGKAMWEDPPYFDFGYMHEDFIATFERIDLKDL